LVVSPRAGLARPGGRSLEEIVATQWRVTQEHLLRDLSDIPPSDIRAIDLADFLAKPEESLRAICDFAGVTFDRPPPAELPLSLHTLTPPARDKWRQHEDRLTQLLPALMPIAEEARAFVAARELLSAPTEGSNTVPTTPLPREVAPSRGCPGGQV
jgi:hypothetical protein